MTGKTEIFADIVLVHFDLTRGLVVCWIHRGRLDRFFIVTSHQAHWRSSRLGNVDRNEDDNAGRIVIER